MEIWRGSESFWLKTVLGIILVAVVCAVGLELLGEWLLTLLFGSSIADYVYLLQPVLLSTVLTAFLWFFGDLLIAVRDFRANFAGNVAAFLAVLPLSVLCVDTWDMNGVSFAGAAACLAGVIVLGVFLVIDIAKQKKAGSSSVEDRQTEGES